MFGFGVERSGVLNRSVLPIQIKTEYTANRRKSEKAEFGCVVYVVESIFGVEATNEETDQRLDWVRTHPLCRLRKTTELSESTIIL